MARNSIAITIVGNASDAVRALRNTAREAGRTNRELSKLQSTTGVFGLVTKVAASRAALLGSGIAAAVPAALALTHALAPLLGLLVALPGSLLAAGTAMAAFKLATAGVGDSIKNAFGGEDITGGGKAVVDAQKVASARARLLSSQLALNRAQASSKTSAGQLALAQQRVALASTALAKAQRGTVAPLTAQQEAFRRLPPAAQQFVRSIISLQSPLRTLQATVANAFFREFAGQIRGLATQWIPALRTGLAETAGSMGRLVSGFATVARSPAVLRSVSSVMRAVSQALDLARPGILALTRSLLLMSSVVSPVLRLFGRYINDVTARFAAWLDTNRKSGRMAQWLGNALRTMRQLFSITGNVLRVFGALVNAAGGQTLLATIDQLTDRLATFLNSTAGQNRLRQFFEGARSAGATILGLFRQLAPVARDFYDAIAPALPVIADVLRQVSQQLIPILADVAAWLKDHRDTIADWAPLIAKAWIAIRLIKMTKWISDTIYLTTLLKGIPLLYGRIKAAQAGAAAAGAAGAGGSVLGAIGIGGLLTSSAGLAVALAPVASTVAAVLAGLIGVYIGKQIGESEWFQRYIMRPVARWLSTTLPNNLFRNGDQVKEFGSGWSGWYAQFKSQSADIGHWFGTTLPNHIFRSRQSIAEFGSGWSGWWRQFTSQSADIGRWFADLGRSISGFFSSTWGSLTSAGADLVTGFVNGIRTRWNQLRQSVISIPGEVVGWFKARLGIHSPSTVMASIGANVVIGLARGIRSNSGVLTSAMAGLSATVTGGFGTTGSFTSASAAPLNVTIRLAPGTSTRDAENQLVGILNNYQRRTGRQILQLAR